MTDDIEPDLYVMYRRTPKGSEFYDYFSESLDDCIKREGALDTRADEFAIYGIPAVKLDKFLSRRFKLREYQKLKMPEKIKLANTFISESELFDSADVKYWKFVNTPEFCGFHLKDQQYAAPSDFWTQRRW